MSNPLLFVYSEDGTIDSSAFLRQQKHMTAFGCMRAYDRLETKRKFLDFKGKHQDRSAIRDFERSMDFIKALQSYEESFPVKLKPKELLLHYYRVSDERASRVVLAMKHCPFFRPFLFYKFYYTLRVYDLGMSLLKAIAIENSIAITDAEYAEGGTHA